MGCLLSGMQTQLRLSDGDEAWSTWPYYTIKVRLAESVPRGKEAIRYCGISEKVTSESANLATSPKAMAACMQLSRKTIPHMNA